MTSYQVSFVVSGVTIGQGQIYEDGSIHVIANSSDVGKMLFRMIQDGTAQGLSISPIQPPAVEKYDVKIPAGKHGYQVGNDNTQVNHF